jgi:steroid delta-isomerase-like uncharacterized protein
MTAEANAANALRVIEQAWNRGNLDVLDELSAPDCVVHDMSTHAEFYGLDANKQRLRGYRTAMPDLHIAIEDLIAGGDKVVTRWCASGTHEGELRGHGPTYRRAEIAGVSIDRFNAEGRLAETWYQWDMLSLMQQLGISPFAGAALAPQP